jgi:hypothetical protein
MESRNVKALLIQERLQGSGQLEKYLRACGCECHRAGSYKEACYLLGVDEFDLVLSPMRLPDTSLFPLLNLLNGSRITLFYWLAVDGGCLWLPALRHGQNCFGSSTLSTGKFVLELETVIKEIRTEASAGDTQPVVANELPGALATPAPR